MKQFLKKMIPFIIFIMVLELAIPMYVDPYNVFHWEKIRDNGVEPNSNYIKTKYIIGNPDKFDSFLFGSSRTGFIDVERIPDGNWYNMSYSEGLPEEHLETLKAFEKSGITPKNVMVGIDNISFFVDPKIHDKQFYRIPYPNGNKLGFLANYFSSRGVIESLDVITNHEIYDEDYVDRYYRSGSSQREIPKNVLWKGDAPYWEDYYSADQVSDTVADIFELAVYCEEKGINLILFTNPIYYKTYQESVIYGYEQCLDWVIGGVPVYNFSGINAITQDRDNYIETSHFNMEVGDMIIDRIFYDKRDEELESQGFGLYVESGEWEVLKEALDNH